MLRHAPALTFSRRVGSSSVRSDHWLSASVFDSFWTSCTSWLGQTRFVTRTLCVSVCLRRSKSRCEARALSECLKIDEVLLSCPAVPCAHLVLTAAVEEAPVPGGWQRTVGGAEHVHGVIMTEKRMSRWYFGGLASCGAACCTHPLDLIKVRGPDPVWTTTFFKFMRNTHCCLFMTAITNLLKVWNETVTLKLEPVVSAGKYVELNWFNWFQLYVVEATVCLYSWTALTVTQWEKSHFCRKEL